MGGVVIGSTMLEIHEERNSIAAVTINDYCQLSCPHCYLETNDRGRKIIKESTLQAMWDANPSRVIIVGKEPLFNRESRRVVVKIAEEGRKRNVPVSIITNGMNLEAFAREERDSIRKIRHIDVSLDATTQERYEQCRPGGVLEDVIVGIKKAQNEGVEIRLLFTISDVTLPWTEENAKKGRELTEHTIMFSPFVETERASGPYTGVRSVPLEKIIDALTDSKEFMQNERAVVLIDPYHCEFTGESMDHVKKVGKKLGSHFKLVSQTPEELGITRFTYNGLVLNPRVALDTAHYPSVA